MNKEEFIKYCINNNYSYTETPSEIIIDNDELENTDFAFIYNKEYKSIIFCCDEHGNKEFNDIEYKIFINLKSLGDSNE